MPITTTPSGGAQGEFSTYTPIYSTTLSSTAASVTFSNIPPTYTDLVLVVGGSMSANGGPALYLNGDTGANYSHTRSWGTSSAVGNDRNSTQDRAYTGNFTTSQGTAVFNFLNYANPNVFKNILSRISVGNDAVWMTANQWRSNSAINTINCAANGTTWASGTVMTLYGIKAAVPLPKATGGDSIVTDGVYWYHTFFNTGLFQTTQAISNVDFLVVAGGGAGGAGNSGGGGGGAGGLRTSVGTSGGGGAAESKLNLTAATIYPVTVGAGGIGGNFYNTGIPVAVNSTNGSNSTFSTITSTGGGRGGQFSMGTSFGPGANGGSGGGGAGESTGTTAGGTGTANQGYAGGTGSTDNATFRSFGGGGGAGGVGSNGGNTNNGVAGGVGLSITSLANPTGTGVSGFYAGGGGGANTNNRGAGGSGGGGAGAVSAIANTGGGGGGVGAGTSFAGNGGSGIVIVRYAV